MNMSYTMMESLASRVQVSTDSVVGFGKYVSERRLRLR